DSIRCRRRGSSLCRVLGLSEIQKPTSLAGRGGLWLQAGDCQIHIGVEDGVNSYVTKAHIAYQIRNLQDWKYKLRAIGIEVIQSIPLPDHDRLEFRDPFGNRIELMQRR